MTRLTFLTILFLGSPAFADDYRDIERLSQLLKDPALCERLRAAASSSELHDTLMAAILPKWAQAGGALGFGFLP